MMEPLGLKKTSSTLSFRSEGSGKSENVGDIFVINGLGGKMKRLSLLISNDGDMDGCWLWDNGWN